MQVCKQFKLDINVQMYSISTGSIEDTTILAYKS